MPSAPARKRRREQHRKQAFHQHRLPPIRHYDNVVSALCAARPASAGVELGVSGREIVHFRACRECRAVMGDLLQRHGFEGLGRIIKTNLSEQDN